MSKYEIIGLCGTVFIFIAFLFNDQKKIRIFDGIGCVLLVAYGLLMHAWTNVVLNGTLIFVHLFKLAKLYKAGEENGSKPAKSESPNIGGSSGER